MLNFEHLKAAAAERERTVPLAGFQDSARIRLFTKREIDQMRLEAVVAGELSNEKLEKLLFMRGLIEPAVTDEQYQELVEGSAGVYLAIMTAIMEENGLTALSQREARRAFSSRS